MTLSVDFMVPAAWAGLVPALGDAVPWGLPLAAFGLGWVASRLARRRVTAAAVPDGQPVIPAYRDAHAAFARELDRVRRYDRSLAILVIKLEDLQTPEGSLGLLPVNGSAPPESHESMLRAARHVMFWNVGYALHDLLRESDLAACDVAHRRYIVLLPEAGEDLAALASSRIEQRLLESIGVKVRRGIAIYRSDGLTIGDLVRAATGKCDRGAASRPVTRFTRISRPRSPRVSDPRS